MMRSMLLAIAALRNHQIYMDVVSSNISNVNTTGYKGSRVSFQELFNQTIRGASAPRDGMGGLNPVQMGLGVALGGVDTLFTQGSLQDTGKVTDLAIQGDGFFVLNGGSGFVYARDGNLDVGLDGTLQSLSSGMKVMGWAADANGSIDTARGSGHHPDPVWPEHGARDQRNGVTRQSGCSGSGRQYCHRHGQRLRLAGSAPCG